VGAVALVSRMRFGTRLLVEDAFVAHDFASQRSGYEAMARLPSNRLPAVLASSDVLAIGAMQMLRPSEVVIPGVSIMGFDLIWISPSGDAVDPRSHLTLKILVWLPRAPDQLAFGHDARAFNLITLPHRLIRFRASTVGFQARENVCPMLLKESSSD